MGLQRIFGAGLFLLVTVAAVPAFAITYGQPDGNGHPSVGGLVSPTRFSDGTWIYCTGTLISPTVFLTAAHCDIGSERVAVTFDSKYDAGDAVQAGRFVAHPLFGHTQSDPHDIAVVIFDLPVTGVTPSRLPAARSLSKLPKGQKFTSVGYGAYEVTNGPGGHALLYSDTRAAAIGTLSSINQAWLRISQNPAHDDGGTCYGDSGGPNFLDASNVIAGLTVTGDAYCKSRNVVYRLDTQDARDFLAPYVSLP